MRHKRSFFLAAELCPIKGNCEAPPIVIGDLPSTLHSGGRPRSFWLRSIAFHFNYII